MLFDKNESTWDLTVIRTSRTYCESYSGIERLLIDIEMKAYIYYFPESCVQNHVYPNTYEDNKEICR